MKVLGIDPGTLIMGYGVIESRDNQQVSLISYGALKTDKRSPGRERLSYLYHEIMEIISKYQPEVVAVEQPFVAKNARTAFIIGRAQAVAILAAANCHLPCFEYTPAEVKQRVANYGASSKEQIQRMVTIQLGLGQMPETSDAADALAVALCHLQEDHLKSLLDRS